MSESQKASFENLLQTDPNFRLDFEAYKMAIKSINTSSFRADVETVILQSNAKRPQQRNRYYWAMAAVISLVVASVYIFNLSQDRTPKFEDIYKPYPNVFKTRNSTNSRLTSALSLYEQGNYSEAAELLKTIKPQSDTVRFYHAMCYYSTNDIVKGNETLQTISKDSTIFETEIYWYLAIGLLATNESPNESVEYLNKIPRTSLKYEKAQQLIKSLTNQ